MTKKELRIKYKNERKKLSFDEIQFNSLEIANLCLGLPIWEKTYFHLFLPIEEQREINTEYILQILAGRDKEIVIAKADFESRKMTHFLLTDNTKIKKNDYGIPEPVDGLEVPVSKIDVVFVPLLAFDQKGHRVGYGKGFYDLFLAECKPDVIKIGLSYFNPEAVISDIDGHDIKLDFCITPDGIYEFNVS
ncbi:5-formyltetrahydrofolate cyclo-ligase [Flavobacterium sp.]|uniref:5-formyltetrahydrofolate cyclo-ligase n=1 Tax=Flavobacterium sp. TaxID=239 RepID=UPI0028BE0B42|nr:5-formyltetrahydrofolate cyclo-ligase [Flavobacterium sp.]